MFTFLLLVVAFTVFLSCIKSKNFSTQTDIYSLVGNRVTRADFDGIARSEAVSMVIGDTAYVGTGFDITNFLKDFWKCNVEGN
jgi:hypothetical protein